MIDGFDLYLCGDLAGAIAVYDEQLSTSPSPPTFANRALAFLSLGNYHAAIDDFRRADELSIRELGGERGDDYLTWIGGVQWCMDDPEAAFKTWLEVVNTHQRGGFHFSDAAGGVHSGLLLWFAAVVFRDASARETAINFMKSKIAEGYGSAWPAPIAKYLLGTIDYTTLMKEAQRIQAVALSHGCQSVFYAAILSRSQDERERANAQMKMAAEYGEERALEIEYFLALHELKRGASFRRID